MERVYLALICGLSLIACTNVQALESTDWQGTLYRNGGHFGQVNSDQAIEDGSQASNHPSAPQLFERYGCAGCHGAEGASPISQHVPVIRGKPAAFIVDNVRQILAGKRDASAARLMHQQYCSEQSPAGSPCLTMPSGAELDKIAGWLDASGRQLPKQKTTPIGLYLTSVEAFELVSKHPKEVLFVDIRTPAEVVFLGMPSLVDANIPYLLPWAWDEWDDKRGTVKLQPSPHFLTRLGEAMQRKGLNQNQPVILLCRSGDRSAKATELLSLAGYRQVYSVIDGFEGDLASSGAISGLRAMNGWKNNALPWSYKLDKAKLVWDIER